MTLKVCANFSPSILISIIVPWTMRLLVPRSLKLTYLKTLDSSREEGPSFTKIHKTYPGLDLKFLSELHPTPGIVHFNFEGKTVYIERFENLRDEVPKFFSPKR